MATFQIKQDTRRARQDGTYPVVIRIYNGEKYRDIGLGISVLKSQFIGGKSGGKVKASHPNAKNLNLTISKKLNEVRDTTLKLQMKEEVITVDRIKMAIVRPVPKYDLIQYGWTVVEGLKQLNKHGNANIYRDAINGLIIHSKRESIEFKELTYEFLQQLESNMLKAGLMINSISVYFRSIRAIYNRAIKEKVVDKGLYPFDDFKIKNEATAKRNISKADIQAMAALEMKKDSPMWHARNYFILSFNLIGISFADMATLKHSDISYGRVIYRRKKTHKLYNIRLTDTAKELIEYYSSPDRTYILPVIPENVVGDPVEERKYIQYGTKTTNKYLKKIGEDLSIPQLQSTYVSRHSIATIAKRMGYSKDLIAEALGHEQGNRITAIYLDSFDQEVIDEMVEAVCRL